MTTTAPAPKGGTAMKQTERIEAPMGGPGRGGPMGGGMVGQKAMTFGPSAKRLIRRMAPERNRAYAVIGLAVVSVFMLAYGPRLLGHATDLIFDAFLAQRPVDFDAVRTTLLQVVGDLRRGIGPRVGPGLPAQRRGAGHRPPDALRRRGQGQHAAAGVLRQAAARRADEPGHQRHRQHQPTLQQTMSQLLTSLLTVVAVLAMMVWISPVLALIALVSVPLSMFVTRGS